MYSFINISRLSRGNILTVFNFLYFLLGYTIQVQQTEGSDVVEEGQVVDGQEFIDEGSLTEEVITDNLQAYYQEVAMNAQVVPITTPKGKIKQHFK